ncbi:MAG: hypothetical protein KDA37_11000 [Planctomycetales bacterium]|nr:hypothetical protein [Planctomycetales bacterium]
MQPSKTTLILLAATLAAILGIGALPSTRIAYHRWQRDRYEKEMQQSLNDPFDKFYGYAVDSWEHHQLKLVDLGAAYLGEFTLEQLRGNHLAFSQVHKDFKVQNTGQTAYCSSHAPSGTFTIWDDEPANRAKWEKFVAEHDTAEFDASAAAES